MASFVCPHCHHSTSIFLEDGVQREAERLDIPVLGSVPLDRGICEDSDTGLPTVMVEGKDGMERGKVFKDIGQKILKKLNI
jgi:ATP-binding protein involved in chromosome partitioning